jgi:tRNA A-37 threonylcarbamoyl transferase component Bud32
MGERFASIDTSHGVVHFRPDAEAWLRELGYVPHGKAVDPDDRNLFHSSENRENATIEPGPRGPGVFEKRTLALTLRKLRKAARRAGRITTPLLHEWDMLWRARDAGIRVPEPIAAGVTRGRIFPKTDFLLTERLDGTALNHMLDWAASRPVSEQVRLSADVGHAVARLHAAGIAFPDLYTKHVYLKRAGDGAWDVGFLDLATAYHRPVVPREERARDLGALAGSLPFRVPVRILAAFLRAYLREIPDWKLRDAWSSVASAAGGYLRLRRFRRGLSQRLDTTPSRPRTSDMKSHDQRATIVLLSRFDIPVRADGGAVPIRDEVATPLRKLLVATFGAGVLPMGDVLPHLHAVETGLAWDLLAPLRAPRRARAIHARWRFFFLRREIARSAFSPAVKRSFLHDLGPDLITAFALHARGPL